MTDKRTYQITIEADGTRPLESFRKHLGDIASEAEARWGFEIEITEVPPDAPTDGFSKANE
jgi:hypothetical protein